jgi:hypothetical protein
MIRGLDRRPIAVAIDGFARRHPELTDARIQTFARGR